MSRPVRSVLLLCWRDIGHPQGGGSETYLQRIGAHLAESGVRVTLRTARYTGAARPKSSTACRSVAQAAATPSMSWRAGDGRGADRSRSAARARPDVVIDTQNGLPFMSRLAFGRRVAVLVHHCHREQWPVAGPVMGKIGWFIESTLSPRVHRRDQYVTVSLPSARELAGLGVDPEPHRRGTQRP